ncbi:class I-like SAM-binding methyltransferase superfamily [Mactra antiquata]
MCSVITSRMLSLLKVFSRPQESKFLFQACFPTRTLATQKLDTSVCIEDISRIISNHINRDERSNKLLVIYNPADKKLIKSMKDKGIENLCCMVNSDSHNFYHSSLEKDILDSHKGTEGVVVLTSFVSSTTYDLVKYILNKQLFEVPDYDGFYSLNSIDWFCLCSAHDVKGLSKFLTSPRLFRTFHDFSICYTMKYKEAVSLFNPIKGKFMKENSPKFSKDRRKNREKLIQAADVHLIHVIPKLDVIKEMNVNEKQMYKVYLQQHKSQDRLIPFIEKWVPGAGRHLIYQGYSMADEIKSLSMENHLKIFKMIRCLPEYEHSMLQTELESSVNIDASQKIPIMIDMESFKDTQ